MRLAMVLNHEELAELQTSVVVEMWDKRLSGRVRRAWLKEFNESEREKAGRLYPLFYDWYLRRGIPETHTFLPGTLTFIQRLTNFFGTI